MTVQDRCTQTYPHPAHSRFGLKDCPGVPITPANAPPVPDGPAPASSSLPGTVRGVGIAQQRLEMRLGEQLRDFERRLGQLEDRVDEHLTPPEYDPADDEDAQAAVQNLLDDATRAFAAADTSSERVEVIRDLLDGWYAAWPKTAVTDPHEGIAWQLASMISAAEARASGLTSCNCAPPAHARGISRCVHSRRSRIERVAQAMRDANSPEAWVGQLGGVPFGHFAEAAVDALDEPAEG